MPSPVHRVARACGSGDLRWLECNSHLVGRWPCVAWGAALYGRRLAVTGWLRQGGFVPLGFDDDQAMGFLASWGAEPPSPGARPPGGAVSIYTAALTWDVPFAFVWDLVGALRPSAGDVVLAMVLDRHEVLPLLVSAAQLNSAQMHRLVLYSLKKKCQKCLKGLEAGGGCVRLVPQDMGLRPGGLL